MNWLKISLIGVFFSLICVSCSTEVDIAAPKKETMAVYGILNPKENVQYIKVFKAFISSDTSALELAQDPNAIYYGEGELEIEITENTSNRKFIAKPILLDTVPGFGPLSDKDYFGFDGVFPQSPNRAYALNFTPKPGQTYSLRVTNVKTQYQVTAQTQTIANFSVRRPFSSTSSPWNWIIPTTSPIEWDKSPEAGIFDVRMALTSEVRDAAFVNILRTDVQTVSIIKAYRDKKFDFTKDFLFGAIAEAIDPLPTTEVRALQTVVVEVVAGNIDYERFINFNEAQNSVGSSQSLKVFTNIQGGVGLFASKTSAQTIPIKVTEQSVDTLACGKLTNTLRYATANNPSRNPNFPYCD